MGHRTEDTHKDFGKIEEKNMNGLCERQCLFKYLASLLLTVMRYD